MNVERQVAMPLFYRGRRMDCGYRIDLLIEKAVIVEVKSVEHIERIHAAKLQHYLRYSKLKLGLLINFNVKWLRDGITRIVNGFPG
jgi:GxxExxY protein